MTHTEPRREPEIGDPPRTLRDVFRLVVDPYSSPAFRELKAELGRVMSLRPADVLDAPLSPPPPPAPPYQPGEGAVPGGFASLGQWFAATDTRRAAAEGTGT